MFIPEGRVPMSCCLGSLERWIFFCYFSNGIGNFGSGVMVEDRAAGWQGQ